MEGRHAEALREYEWFHRNALKHRPSLYGVRLSFALRYWTELGKVYPKARESLERIRRRKTAVLRSGRGNPDLFHDVASINKYVNRQHDTYRLFVWLDVKHPRMAAKCVRVALPALVKARDFKLARRHMPDPEVRVARYAEFMNRELPKIRERVRKSGTKAPVKDAYIANYCDDVALLVGILNGAGERRKAALLRKSAVALLNKPLVRRLVAARLRR
jgi:hypothetical protein